MNINILFTEYDYPIYELFLDIYKDILPNDVKEKAFKFKRWQDRQAFLIGKLLIWKGLTQFNYENDCLTRIQFNSYGKPYIDQNIFFNLSHSGQYVICAFFTEEIGIDIEEIKEIEIDDFNKIFTEGERKCLKNSRNPTNDFFRYWTMKESIIKAEGKGLSIPLDLIDTSNAKYVIHNNTTWYLEEINCFPKYSCSLATKFKNPRTTLEKIDLHKKAVVNL